MIPRIFHQTWKTRALPVELERYRASWLRNHPTWEHRFYDDEACSAFVQSLGAPWPEIYLRLPTPIQRADLFRYLVVHKEGGVYADVDMECFRPVDALVDGADCVLAIEAHLTERRRGVLRYAEPRQLANCVFATRAGDPFLSRVLQRVATRTDVDVLADADVEESTGPRMLTRVFESMSETEQTAVRVVPQVSLIPPSWPRPVLLLLGSYARHHFAGSWKRDTTPPRSLWTRWIERDQIPPLTAGWRSSR